MIERWPNFLQALEASEEIAERCQLELPLGILHFPEISLAEGMTSQEMLRQKAEAGAVRLYGRIDANLQARLDHELSVIGEYGYSSLFLIVEEILNFARREGIPFSSRGSAGSSLVATAWGSHRLIRSD
jgi:DNA polymerase III alpha subunit